VVAAIHGTALGGGLEVALACHYRVAVASARCGLPEVKLGLLPGAGGTQRLPRVIGAKPALEMIVSGEPIDAARARELGLVDEIVDGDLVAGAIVFAERMIGKPVPRASQREDKIAAARGELGMFDEYAQQMQKSRRGYEAPQLCIEAVRNAVTLPFAEGVKQERQLFERLRSSDQSKAQRHVFFAEREASKIPDVPADTPTLPVHSVAILGAGTMGAGIAIACANAGLSVILLDREQAFVDKGLASIQQTFAGSVKRGKLSEAQAKERVGRIRGTTRYEDLTADVDLVIEAVFEEMAIKKEVFATLDRVCKPGAILATNTSTLDVNEIARATKRPEDVIGLHFFSPANIMRLLEIVRGSATSKPVINTSMKLSKTLDKIAVLVGVCHGFVGNRMLYPYRREALFLVEEGAMPQQVDKAIQDFGFAMGPFAVSDLAGLDIGWRVRKAQGKPADERYSGTLADRLCEAGHYGQKTGQGFYKYEGGRTPKPYPEMEQMILQASKELGITRRAISDEEIVERCIYAMINEGCKILEEGIALRASDIDVVWLNGYGFPGYRGGPMFYGDQIVGLGKVHETVARFREQHGKLWQPSPLLEKLAKSGAHFDA
jgi:3-hydroxyacyl-CoA dehydrogenase